MLIKMWPTLVGLAGLFVQLGICTEVGWATQPADPESAPFSIASEIVLEWYPDGVAFGFDSLWILQNKTLLRVDLVSHQTVAQIPLKGRLSTVTTFSGKVLVACEGNRVFVVDPSTNQVSDTLQAKGQILALTHGEGRLWILRALGKISRVSSGDPMRVDTLKVIGKGFSVNQNDLAYQKGTLWILNSKKGRLIGVDAETGKVTHDSIDVGKGAWRVVAGGDSVWVVDARQNEVARIDPAAGRITTRIPVGKTALDAVFLDGDLWVVNAEDWSLTRIDPLSNTTTTRRVPKTQYPIVEIFAGDGSLWLTTYRDYRVIRLQEPDPGAVVRAEQAGAAPARQCLTGPEYHKEMLEKECDSTRAIEGGPVGRLAAMVPTGDSGWAFAGTTDDRQSSLTLIQTDREGTVLWEKRFSLGAESRAVDVATLEDKGLAVTGDIRSDRESPWETVVARVDASGNSIWEKRYPREGSSRLVSQIAALPGGELAIAGSLLSTATPLSAHGFITRIGDDGAIIWDAELEEIESVDRFGQSGSEIVLMGPPRGQVSLQLLRVDLEGHLIESVRAANENVQATDLVAMAGGGWAVVSDPGEWAGKGHLLRLDSEGRPLWCRYLGSANAYKWVWKLLLLDDGSLLAAATPRHSQSFSGSKGFLNIAHISADGEFLGEQLFKGFAGRQVVGLFPWSEGSVVFTVGDWRGSLGQKMVRAHQKPKRRYSGLLRTTTRIVLDAEGHVREEGS